LLENVVSKLPKAGHGRIIFCMTARQNLAFNQLLSAWRRREEARSTATIAELSSARASLDAARTNMSSTLHTSVR
jgi:hypothetical protein